MKYICKKQEFLTLLSDNATRYKCLKLKLRKSQRHNIPRCKLPCCAQHLQTLTTLIVCMQDPNM